VRENPAPKGNNNMKLSEIQTLYQRHTISYGLRFDCLMGGDPLSEVVIIGDYPGEQEQLMHKPFIGGAGKHLWKVLRPHGLNRANTYQTNVAKRRASSKDKIDEAEFALWQEALQYELSLLPNAKIIIALGGAALSALGFDGDVSKMRGSVYDYNGCKVIASLNPAYVVRMPQHELIFMFDMQRAVDVWNGEFVVHEINKIINPTYAEAMDYLRFIRHDRKRFAFDIEVIGGETACWGFASSATDAMCIALRNAKENVFSVEEEYNLLREICATFDDPSTFSIAQNGNFDCYFAGYKDWMPDLKLSFDTLLAHHLLYPRLPHNLGFLTAQYTTHPYYKDEKDTFREGGDIDGFWRYNATDAAITFACCEGMEKELEEAGLDGFFYDHVMAVRPELTRATIEGVRVDTVKKESLNQQLTRDVQQHLDAFTESIRIATGDKNLFVNPRAPRQLQSLYFDQLGLQSKTRSVDATTRDRWLTDPRVAESIKQSIILLNVYLKEAKFLSTYVNANIDPDGRFRSEYKQYGVSNAPGRLSSSKTLWGSGGNAQNLPRRSEEMFITDDDDVVFIYFDLAQAEARYVGWDAVIEQWMEDFERARTTPGFDAHRALAAVMFNVPYDDVPKEDIDPVTGEFTIRYIAKRCRHGLNYRMMAPRLAETTGLSLNDAIYNYAVYHRTNPELQPWWRKLEQVMRRDRMLYNSYGRRLFITERLDNPGVLDSIVAFRPQSAIGDKVQRVWRQCHADDGWDLSRMKIFRNVHDALWGMALKPFALQALSIMKKYAEEPIMVRSIMDNKVRPLIIPADLKMSNWHNKEPLTMGNMMKVEL
jgi:uracil-DNA glycosylase family 4